MAFDYFKLITIDHTKIDSNLTNYPVMVKLDDSNFDFDKVRDDGYDIVFKSSDGNTTYKHEIELFERGITLNESTSNVAYGKSASFSESITNGASTSQLVDNVTTTTPYIDCGANGLTYAQIDLGAVYGVDQITVWHYWGNGRTYYDTKTQVSKDGTNWTTVFDSAVSGTYAETSGGHNITFDATEVRYIRDYINGSTSNSSNHWVEIKVFGTDDYSGGNKGVYHVKVPSVSSSSDTTFRVYFGDSSITTDQSDKENVWDSNFVMVQHMGESLEDSTSNNNDGTSSGTSVVDGLNGKARDFSNGDYINCGVITYGSNDEFTVTTIVSITATSTAGNLGDYFGDSRQGFMFYNSFSQWYSGDTSGNFLAVPQSTYDFVNTGYHLAIARLDSTKGDYYIDGSNEETDTRRTSNSFRDSSYNFYLGRSNWGVNNFTGIIDEVRISNIARSDAWIKADDYNLRTNTLITISDDTTNYAYRRELTIDHDKVDAALTDYPVMVKLNFLDGVEFNGTNQYADCGNSMSTADSVEFTGVGEMTISKWSGDYYFTFVQARGDYIFYYTRYTTTNYRYYSIDTSSLSYLTEKTTIKVDFSDKKVYINGEEFGTMTLGLNNGTAYGWSNISGNAKFGTHLSNGVTYYDEGTLSYVCFRNSSDEKISEYLFDEYSGTSLNDNVGSNDATLYNSPTWHEPDMDIDKLENSDGYDLIFKATNGDVLKHEIEYFGGTSAVYHVKIPSISASVDTKFYMYYGNPYITSNQSDKENVWDSNFVMVQHMGESLEDSTSNGNDGSNEGTTVVDGLNGKARNFDGSNDYIEWASNGNGIFSNQSFTNQFIHSHDTLPTYSSLWSYDYTSHSAPYYAQTYRLEGDDLYFGWNISGVGTSNAVRANNVYNTTNYFLTSFSFESGSQKVVVNGTSQGTGTETGIITYYDQEVWSGKANYSALLDGKIDEIRISNIVRSDAWIKADDYNLRLNTLLTLGEEQEISDTALIFFGMNF